MKQFMTYGIIKTYKGFFTKTHIGNGQFLVIPCSSTFMVLNLLGRMEDGKYASQMLLRTGVEYLQPFINHFKEEENFIPVEEVGCVVKEKGGGNYLVTIPKKGKHFKSNLDIIFEPEYSSGNIQIYMIDGKIELIMDTDINGSTQLKMLAASQRAKSIDILQRIVSKFMR